MDRDAVPFANALAHAHSLTHSQHSHSLDHSRAHPPTRSLRLRLHARVEVEHQAGVLRLGADALRQVAVAATVHQVAGGGGWAARRGGGTEKKNVKTQDFNAHKGEELLKAHTTMWHY
jgi:hypothetical protein